MSVFELYSKGFFVELYNPAQTPHYLFSLSLLDNKELPVWMLLDVWFFDASDRITHVDPSSFVFTHLGETC